MASFNENPQQLQQSEPLAPSLILAPNRKLIIQQALKRLKYRNRQYMANFQTSKPWQRIEQSFAILNIPTTFQKLVQFRLCEAQQPEKSYFNPFRKIPITLCYNKIGDQSQFYKLLTYNLILLHDSKAKRDMDWNNVQSVVKTNIRALNISEICKKDDKTCFKEELKNKVDSKDRFGNKKYDFEKLYGEAIQDLSPLSQIVFRSS